MILERQLRDELKQYASSQQCPPDMHARLRQQMEQAMGKGAFRPARFRRGVMAAAISAALLLPAAAFAGNPMLADRIYGSFEQLKKKMTAVTMEQYAALAGKLSGAQAQLGEKEYARYEALLKQYVRAAYEYGNGKGYIDFDALPAEKRAEMKQLLRELQPYFDRLNGERSAKEVLSPEAFDRYIEAQMTYQTVLAQAGIEAGQRFTSQDIPAHLRDRFEKAEAVIREVSRATDPRR
ncbi:DUF3600 domain-containing protein [Brevibacillus sp. SYP-B805]|uniref:DUF3600 domain-containing protein n=1 Tax=Brevibacillus sp. SYP-B805 TaxID=1578199 RepID=UPI0013EDC06F|nr:DUF3600 domain-containing protein [Brevibacillus sp. SYP-B805]NGQ94198.1 DUF3600 domain-containing protein [Brevibacillus sp. SYP-B805]